jgi:para-aminobenzoate synthetase component 1
MVGYFGYDFGLHLEKIPLQAEDDLKLPDCFFGLYDCILTIDHYERKLHICSSGLPEKNAALRARRAAERLKEIEKRLSENLAGKPMLVPGSLPDGPTSLDLDRFLESNFTPGSYRSAVEQALGHIARGDIYQVNLSQRFVFDPKDMAGPWKPLDLYRRLRHLSPANFSGLMNCGDSWILSSSPERFLRLSGRTLETRPMKGTRPRGITPQEDRKLRNELLKSPKEIAELLMITDLERNDLGRVCRYGSVKVREMRTIEEYSTVFQTTSTVEGTIRDDKDALDVIEACFPGGSITGCPKIRAMEIIEALEPVRRGIYTGALGYIDFSGDMDFNIMIRTLLLKNDKIYFHVGGGVVADSDPQKEYEETLVKAKAMGMCLRDVFGRSLWPTFS